MSDVLTKICADKEVHIAAKKADVSLLHLKKGQLRRHQREDLPMPFEPKWRLANTD